MTIEEIKKYMKNNKITQVELSKKSGIPLVSLNDIFRGKIKNPRLDTMNAICDALNLDYSIDNQGNLLKGMQILHYRTSYKNTIVLFDNSGDKYEFNFKKEDFNHILNVCEALTKEYRKIDY